MITKFGNYKVDSWLIKFSREVRAKNIKKEAKMIVIHERA